MRFNALNVNWVHSRSQVEHVYVITLQKMLGKLSTHSIVYFNLFVMQLSVDELAKIPVDAIYIHE